MRLRLFKEKQRLGKTRCAHPGKGARNYNVDRAWDGPLSWAPTLVFDRRVIETSQPASLSRAKVAGWKGGGRGCRRTGRRRPGSMRWPGHEDGGPERLHRPCGSRGQVSQDRTGNGSGLANPKPTASPGLSQELGTASFMHSRCALILFGCFVFPFFVCLCFASAFGMFFVCFNTSEVNYAQRNLENGLVTTHRPEFKSGESNARPVIL